VGAGICWSAYSPGEAEHQLRTAPTLGLECLSDFRPGSATSLLPRTSETDPCYVRHNYWLLNKTTGEAERTVSDLDALVATRPWS
jgi:hypothetical protein